MLGGLAGWKNKEKRRESFKVWCISYYYSWKLDESLTQIHEKVNVIFSNQIWGHAKVDEADANLRAKEM